MATLGSWNEVLAMLRPLWEDKSFRSEWWLDISEDILWVMRRAAAETGRADIVVAIDWELMNEREFDLMPLIHMLGAKLIPDIQGLLPEKNGTMILPSH
jgi:hypothetical protein